MSDAATKTCSKCGEVKAVVAFRKIGMQCKVCLNAAARKRYEVNPEKVAANSKKWRQANPEKARANSAKWEKSNKDQRIAKRREWNLKNRKKRAQQESARRQANLERARERERLVRERLPDSYVRNKVSKLTGLEYINVPPELIKVKRKHLQILRKLKEKTDEHKVKKSR